MNQASRALLIKLLHSWQKNPQRSRKTTLAVTRERALPYFEATLPEEKEALHAGLSEAEASGAIELEWGKGYESHLLSRIVLADGPALARYLGLTLAATVAGEARPVLEPLISGRESWIRSWVEELLDRWSRNQPLDGIMAGDLSTAKDIVTALEAVSAGRHLNLDLRTFSSRELGSSKAMEAILTRFAAVWKRYHPVSTLTTDELLQVLGLVKFPQPILLRGPVTLRLAKRDLDCEELEPFVGVPPQAIRGVLIDKTPDFVLAIENLASFNRHTAEIIDRGLIIYTAGFPSPGLVEFIKMLDATLPVSTPFYHWGDIDEGGLKIFAYISAAIGRPLRPHLMTPELLEAKGQAKAELRSEEVRRVAETVPALTPLAAAILSTVPPKVLEQENLDPCYPIGGRR